MRGHRVVQRQPPPRVTLHRALGLARELVECGRPLLIRARARVRVRVGMRLRVRVRVRLRLRLRLELRLRLRPRVRLRLGPRNRVSYVRS